MVDMTSDDDREWRLRRESFINSRQIAVASREMYRRDLDVFRDWCLALGQDTFSVDELAISDYWGHLQSIPHKPATIDRELRVLKLFFEFLVASGLRADSPVPEIFWDVPRRGAPEAPSLDQLRALWLAASDPRDRIVVGLIGMCAMTPTEVQEARFQDLSEVESLPVLRIPTRRRRHERPYVVLPELVFAEIEKLRTVRKTGHVLVRNSGQPHDRNSLWSVVKRIGRAADLPFDLTAKRLHYSLRAIAIDLGFPYGEVVRAVGEQEPRRLIEWISRTPSALVDHPAIRLGQLVTYAPDSTQAHLSHARGLLRGSDAHQAAAAGYAAAALERHLRERLAGHGAAVRSNSTKLGGLAAALRAHNAIGPQDVQAIARIQVVRDNAAHGHFDKVSIDDARWVVGEVERIIKPDSSS